MSVEHTVAFRFQHNPATHRPEAAHIDEITLTLLEAKPRHNGQLVQLRQISPHISVSGPQLPGVDPLLDQCACFAVDQRARDIACINGEPAFRDVLYLFNIIVALEWNPSPASYQQIRLAMARASDFLYDVTNGYMAVGHVIVGGPDLMDVADIQVMASNRIHPRSWMAALNEEQKFKPIRVGRGLWQKNQSSLLTWDSPEGYRGLVHEWGHYAFGLPDEYLQTVSVARGGVADRFWRDAVPQAAAGWSASLLDLAAPDVALAVESLMANTQISEYANLPRTFAFIQKYYPLASDASELDGPDALPLPLPYFPALTPRLSPFVAPAFTRAAVAPEVAEEAALPIESALSGARAIAKVGKSAAEAHWIYLLKAHPDSELPQRLIAQGKIGRRDIEAGSFRLLGAAPGDQVVVISQVGSAMVTQRATLDSAPAPAGQPGGAGSWQIAGGWANVSPPQMNTAAPIFVDVIPEPLAPLPDGSYPMHADLRVQVEAPIHPSGAAVYPSGAGQGSSVSWPASGSSSNPVGVPHLDGHVLLHWQAGANGGEGLFICSYSQGGGPRTSSGGILPITGGSADGNAMIFFNDNVQRLPVSPPGGDPVTLRLVTTTITVGEQRLASGAEARSYIFSLASNMAMDSYKAALVLYYDSGATRQGSDLLIYRWDRASRAWQPLSTFVRPELPYVAVPIGDLDDHTALETAPALTGSTGGARVERYRIFLTPGGSPATPAIHDTPTTGGAPTT